MWLIWSFLPKSKHSEFWIYLKLQFKWNALWNYINLTQNMQWISKLKKSHTWGKNHLQNPVKCIELKEPQLIILITSTNICLKLQLIFQTICLWYCKICLFFYLFIFLFFYLSSSSSSCLNMSFDYIMIWNIL